MRRLSLFVLFLVAATAGAGLALAVDGLVPDAPAPVRPIELIVRNRINGNLQCRQNNPPPRGWGNVVGGNKEDRCRRCDPASLMSTNAPAGQDLRS